MLSEYKVKGKKHLYKNGRYVGRLVNGEPQVRNTVTFESSGRAAFLKERLAYLLRHGVEKTNEKYGTIEEYIAKLNRRNT